MRISARVAAEMRKEAGAESARFQVSKDGLIYFEPDGPYAELPIKRAAALIRALPDTPLAVFSEQTKNMPASTEAERLERQRIGQDIFRDSLEDYWGGKCALTGIVDSRLLRASHTKLWALCETDEERLDVYNGLLLAAHMDAAFDSLSMTISCEGNGRMGVRSL